MDNLNLNVTTDSMARCLVVLKNAEGPATAAQIAGKLNLGGSRETQRRRVRAILACLRKHGHWIIATLQDGCWLTMDKAMWTDYCEHKMIDAKRIIGEANRRKQSVLQDAAGQGLLFSPNKAF
jgi:hypothetical protein